MLLEEPVGVLFGIIRLGSGSTDTVTDGQKGSGGGLSGHRPTSMACLSRPATNPG